MSVNDSVIISNTNLTNTAGTASKTRAKSFKVSNVSEQNYSQYVRTVKAYALAGMSFQDIANAGDLLEDEVERMEIDAPLQQDWKNKLGEVAEDESKILAWQTRGEKVSVAAELSAPSMTGREVVIISKGLITSDSNQAQTIEVVEGIQVSQQDTSKLPNSASNDSQLENNPYLKPIPNPLTKP